MEGVRQSIVCIIAAIFAIYMHFSFVLSYMLHDETTKNRYSVKEEKETLVDILMDIFVVIGGILFIYAGLKKKRMLMMPFVVILIIYALLNIYHLCNYFSGRRIFETTMDIFVIVPAMIVFFDMRDKESLSENGV